MSKTILILDSSQIDTFLTCPTQWYYSYKRRLIPNNARENTPMDMGTYGHKLLEIIYKERAKGNDKNALDVAFAYDIDKETCRCAHGQETHGYKKLTRKEIPELDCISEETIGACQSIGCTCKGFEPIEFPLSAPDRAFVRNRVLDYTFVEGVGIPELIPTSPEHVEVGFSHKLYEDENRLYILEGRIDLLGQIANNCTDGWADHKFQSRERDLYLKSIQFRNYSMVTGLSIGVVNYIRFAKKVEKDKTFKRSIISFSRLEIEAWRQNLIRIYSRIENALTFLQEVPIDKRWYSAITYLQEASDDKQWYQEDDTLRNRAACSGKFGYPCDYTQLCENFFAPDLIKIYESSEYKQKPEWRPW